jgi:hypothetical protein
MGAGRCHWLPLTQAVASRLGGPWGVAPNRAAIARRPLTRIVTAKRRVERLERQLADARAAHRAAIRAALAEGETLGSIGKLLDISRQRVADLAKQRD